jgi:O-antigen/teichoic acid export membrane protein
MLYGLGDARRATTSAGSAARPSRVRASPVAHGMSVPPVDHTAVPPEVSPAPPRLLRVVGSLTVVNAFVAASALVTGPLQARALGADGRGDLAAIITPLFLASAVLSLGLGAYASREVARRGPDGEVIGTTTVLMVAFGAIGPLIAFPVATWLAEGRDTVRLLLVVGFALMPLSLVGLLLPSVLAGLAMWRRLVWTRLLPAVTLLVGVPVLYALGELTVASAAILGIAGGLLSLLPGLSVYRLAGRLRATAATAREATVFGAKTWVSGLAQLANARVDQLLMIKLVTPRELGLYAVAVTVASVPTFLSSAVTAPVLTRVAEGDRALVPRALRALLAVVVTINLCVAAALPIGIPLLFGEAFSDAVPMALVLVAASVPLAGISVLSPSLTADGAPGVPSVGEIGALAVTIAGLALLLDPLGGVGAAITSLVAYSASFAYQLVVVRRRFGGSFASYLVPRRADLVALRDLRRRPR